MKFLCLLRSPDDPSKPLPKAEADALIQEHLEYDHELQRRGAFVTAGALAPGSAARTVRVRNGVLSVTDGPYAETKEEVGGFFVLEAASVEEACRLAAGIPTARSGAIEVRPFRQLYDDLYPGARPAPAAGAPPEPRFEEKPALALAGFGNTYTGETMARIPAQWMRFGGEVGPVSDDKTAFGLCYEWRDGTMEYACAAPARAGARLPAGWRALALPAARYAVFRHDGHVSDMTRVASWILRDWLPTSGRRRARGFAGGIELIEWYGPRFDPQAGFGDIELWLPLEG